MKKQSKQIFSPSDILLPKQVRKTHRLQAFLPKSFTAQVRPWSGHNINSEGYSIILLQLEQNKYCLSCKDTIHTNLALALPSPRVIPEKWEVIGFEKSIGKGSGWCKGSCRAVFKRFQTSDKWTLLSLNCHIIKRKWVL